MHSSPLALAILAFSMTAGTAVAEEGPIAFTHAAIETAGKPGRIENGTLLLRDGKVEAVGEHVKIPDDARVIDAHGKTIMPGIVDPFHEVSIAGSTVEAAPRPMVVGRRGRGGQPARGGLVNSAFVRIADNFYPYDASYRALLRSGLTGLNLVTNGYGQSALVRVTPAQPDRMLVNPDGFVFTAVTSDTSSLDIVRTALETAEKVKKGVSVTLPSAPPATTESTPTPEPRARQGRRRGGRPGAPGGGPPPALDSATLKLWQAVYEGKAPFFANAANAAAIVHLLKAVEPYKDVKLVLVASGPALYETVDQLAGRSVRLLIQPGLSLKPNTRDRIDIAHVLHEAHLEFAFTQPTNRNDLLAAQDFPLFSVAYLVKCGLPRKVAVEALTARPAALLGLDKTHGTIEPGKSADVLIFTGDPLDPGSELSQVLIEGRMVYEN